MESSAFNVKMSMDLFEMELLEKEREVQTSLKEKNMQRQVVLEMWRSLRSQLKNRKCLLKCAFQGRAHL